MPQFLLHDLGVNTSLSFDICKQPTGEIWTPIFGNYLVTSITVHNMTLMLYEYTCTSLMSLIQLKRKSYYRCGGFIGCDIQERPYLTEAGPAAFDLLYRLNLSCQLQIDYSRVSRPGVRMSQAELSQLESRRHLYNITMKHLMEDVSKLLVGVSSKCFYFDKVR